MRVSTADITRALENALRTSVLRIERRPHAYMTSSLVEDVDVFLSDGRYLSMIFKDLRAEARRPEARGVKPAFLNNPGREIGIYRDILTRVRLGTAECHVAADDWLLLERIRGHDLGQVGDLDTWKKTATWLRHFHDSTAPFIEEICATSHPPLLVHDAQFWWRWMRRATRFHPKVSWLMSRYQSVLNEFCSLPTSLIHGEFYPSNVMVGGEDVDRICPVDWEMAGIGPSMLDVAALTEGPWSEGDRSRILSGYLGPDPISADSQRVLDLCRLQLCVQWLGWSENWRPPQQQDWATRIAEIAEKLDL